MKAAEVDTVVEVTLMALARIAQRTRNPADDLLITILRANQDRLTTAVSQALLAEKLPPTEHEIVIALREVGIDV